MTTTVVKHTWWYQICPKHGKKEHMSILDNQCVECYKENNPPEKVVDKFSQYRRK